jgi:hypothetical protein
MSHFFVIVLVPGKTLHTAIKPMVDALLAPYSENLEVEEYSRPCWCVGKDARHTAEHTAEAAYPIESLRARLAMEHREAQTRLDALRRQSAKFTPEERTEFRALSDRIDDAWAALLAPHQALEADRFAADPRRTEADPACGDCKGTGSYRSTSNPRGYWDWCRIGGRWDKAIRGEEAESADNGFNFGDKHTEIRNNALPVSELPSPLPDDRIPFALVTPDGEWHQRGKMGWFASVSKEMPRAEWDAKVRALLATNGDAIAVGVDCHV